MNLDTDYVISTTNAALAAAPSEFNSAILPLLENYHGNLRLLLRKVNN